MNKNFYLPIVFLFCSFGILYAQEAVHIGIIPFSPADNNAGAVTTIAEEQVASCFVNKGRFYLLDRGVTEKLKRELDATKENSSLYSKVVAQQGHLAGAQYLITGKVNSLELSSSTSKNYLTSKTTTNYHGTVRIALQINSVESGQVIFQEPFTIISSDFENNSSSDILDNIMCRFKSAVRNKVRNLFSSDITIIHVEKEKNGIPQKVLINVGKEMFEDGKNSNCEPSSSIASFFTKKIVLDVIVVDNVSYGGTTAKREKKIGELKVDSVEGDVSVCDVSKGDKDIKACLDAKTPLIIKAQ
jgi:hypothetical protein